MKYGLFDSEVSGAAYVQSHTNLTNCSQGEEVIHDFFSF